MVKVHRLFVKTNLKIQFCRTYSTIIKDRLHRVGGLFSYSEIFDFELSFLGNFLKWCCKIMRKNIEINQINPCIIFLILPKNQCIGNWFQHIFKNSNLSYRMKGALNKPSFRQLFFSIQMTSLKSTCSVLEAIAKEDFHHRLHTYRYLFCKGSSASPHRFCLGVLKYIECCWEASGSESSFLSCSCRKAGHSGEFGQNL